MTFRMNVKTDIGYIKKAAAVERKPKSIPDFHKSKKSL